MDTPLLHLSCLSLVRLSVCQSFSGVGSAIGTCPKGSISSTSVNQPKRGGRAHRRGHFLG